MNKLIEEAKKLGWFIEIKEISQNYKMLRTLNHEVKQYETSNIKNYEIKTIIENKTIKINTENIDNIEFIIKDIKDSFELLDNTEKDSLAKESIIDENKNEENFDIDKIRNDLLELNKFKEKDKRILNIDSIVEENIKSIYIKNSNDVELKQQSNFKYMFISINVSSNDKVSESNDVILFNNYNKKDLLNLFNKVYKDAINRIQEKTIKTQKYNIIIDNNSMYSILNTFKDMFCAKNINKGLSILADKYEQQVFSNLINIVEEPLNNHLDGTYRVLFDSEGTKCQNKTIIKEGKFINKLYDNKEAFKENLSSTGSCIVNPPALPLGTIVT